MRPAHFITAILAIGAGALGLGWGQAAQSQDRNGTVERPKAVLELYTSQGCSSCPAADALLKTYIDRGDVVALSLPVDYWDYLGWKDTLASARFTERQKTYAKMRGDGRIYTPQIIVNGIAHANGAHAPDIEKAIAKTSGKLASERVPVSLKVADGRIVIETGAVGEGDKAHEGTIWLASIEKQVQVAVRGGENHGHTLTYYNVVRDLKAVGNWNGKPIVVKLDRQAVMKPDADSCAVLLQEAQAGPIIGAAMASW
jgi:hypothetical protein